MKNKTFWKWAGLGLLLIGLFVASRFLPFGEWITAFAEWVKGKGALGVAIFVIGYVIGTVFFFPGSLMTLAAGVVFGLGWGTVVAALSAITGAALAFLIARYLARGAIEKRAAKSEKFKAIDTAIGEKGWKIVGLLRLSPLVPFNLSNYFFGLTKIGFWPYVLSSFVGMLPGTFLYVYLGHVGKATLGGKHERSTQEYIFLGVGLAATIAVSIYVGRLAKKALKQKKGVKTVAKK
ncbi:MAG: TVP38/TMEM64 family protein [Verrucomicrobiota bacterium]|nr:TVP38/TMEM64 family protein [Verrucomicrobiota bacterium]